MKIPFINKEFETKKEAIDFLKANKQELVNLKKSQDCYTYGVYMEPLADSNTQYANRSKQTEKSEGQGAESGQPKAENELKVKLVLNTTGYMDSHCDVHIAGLWKKSLEQNRKGFYLLREHKASFENVIAHQKDVKAYTEFRNWADLGEPYEGQTECLIFEATIKKEVNPFMFEQYQKGYVKNHSVGMRYIKLELAIYDEEDEKEMDFWNKYISQVANRERAEELGYFWVVTEAQLREGSAVLFGSNDTTPVLETKGSTSESIPTEPQKSIQEEPQEETKDLSLIYSLLND